MMPTQVVVGPFTYDVHFGHENCHAGTLGTTRSSLLNIAVSDKQPEMGVKDTTLHEVIHAIIDLQGACFGNGPLAGEGVEEDFVRPFASLLLGVMRDNPAFVEWLIA